MDELAARAVDAVAQVEVLFAPLRFVLYRLLHCFSQLLRSMCESALLPEFTKADFPVETQAGFVVQGKGGSALATRHRDKLSGKEQIGAFGRDWETLCVRGLAVYYHYKPAASWTQ